MLRLSTYRNYEKINMCCFMQVCLGQYFCTSVETMEIACEYPQGQLKWRKFTLQRSYYFTTKFRRTTIFENMSNLASTGKQTVISCMFLKFPIAMVSTPNCSLVIKMLLAETAFFFLFSIILNEWWQRFIYLKIVNQSLRCT